MILLMLAASSAESVPARVAACDGVGYWPRNAAAAEGGTGPVGDAST